MSYAETSSASPMPSTSALLWIMEQGVGCNSYVPGAWLRIGPVARLDRLGMSSGVEITFPLRNLTSRGSGSIQHLNRKGLSVYARPASVTRNISRLTAISFFEWNLQTSRQAIDFLFRPMQEGSHDSDSPTCVQFVRMPHKVHKLRAAVFVARSSMDAQHHNAGFPGKFHKRCMKQICVTAADFSCAKFAAFVSHSVARNTKKSR